MSKSTLWLLAGVHMAAFASPTYAQTIDPALQDIIIVNGSRQETPDAVTVLPDLAPVHGNDITRLAARTPGGARIGNGELSGQMQYRGLFGERLNLRVDGQRFASGGPNLMDPVFHYAPTPLIAAIKIDRGVSPVAEGPGLAGGADAVFKRVDYSQATTAEWGYDLSASVRSVNESVSIGGVGGAATATWRFNVLGASEEGGDSRYPRGDIGGTAFKRRVYGLSAGVKTAVGEFTVDARRQNTDPSGNPPFPMDIQYFDTDFIRIGYRQALEGVQVNAAIHYTDVAHLMDNFSLRPAPPAMRQRATYAEAQTVGAEIDFGVPALGGELLFGVDFDEVTHDVTITNPQNAAFFVTPFPHIELGRTGAFIQWQKDEGAVKAEFGLRLDNHDYKAGVATFGTALPLGPQNLAQAFNAGPRSGDDLTFDGVARFWTQPNNGLSWRVTMARKQKMPGYIQRYGWLPINASGGLADGNIYVGDHSLEAETAWIGEVGLDYAGPSAYLRPTLFLRDIDNYVQGVPFDDTPGVINSPVEMIAAMGGDMTPLRWDNVDARLYGFDMDGGYDFNGPLRIDGVLGYVRGKRRDINDNLYRVSAPNLTVGVTWEAKQWSATLESRAVAQQDDVAVSNDEGPTPGYVLLNLYGDWEVKKGVRLSAGIENLLDKSYADHLSGINRNGWGDVPVGDKIPGAGRGVFVKLHIKR